MPLSPPFSFLHPPAGPTRPPAITPAGVVGLVCLALTAGGGAPRRVL